MTDKEAIHNALEHYILVNAATEYDPEVKVTATKRCLEELKTSEKVTKDWLLKEYPTIFRSIYVYRKYLSSFIKESSPFEDTSREKEELRVLERIRTLFNDLPELPL